MGKFEILKIVDREILILEKDINQDEASEYFVLFEKVFKIECPNHYFMRK